MNPILDPDTTYHPVRLTISNILYVIWVAISFLALATLSVVIAYLVSCYYDNRLPIDMLEYKAEDTTLGGKFHVKLDAYRVRFCEVDNYKYATDAAGSVIFADNSPRPINGSTQRRVINNDDYQMNGRAVAGTATMHNFFRWRCPNNIVHKWKPIEKEYTDTFEIYATEEDKRAGKKTVYVPPPIPHNDDH